MNKQDLVGAVAKRLDVTSARAAEITELFFAADGVIASELKRGGKVAISGFGSFETRRRAAARGPQPAHRQGHEHQGVVVAGVPGRPGAAGIWSTEALAGRTPARLAAVIRRAWEAAGAGQGAAAAAAAGRGPAVHPSRHPPPADRGPVQRRRHLLRLLRRDLHQRVRVPQLDPPDLAALHPELLGQHRHQIVDRRAVLLAHADVHLAVAGMSGSAAGAAARRGAGPELEERGRHGRGIVPLEQRRQGQQGAVWAAGLDAL